MPNNKIQRVNIFIIKIHYHLENLQTLCEKFVRFCLLPPRFTDYLTIKYRTLYLVEQNKQSSSLKVNNTLSFKQLKTFIHNNLFNWLMVVSFLFILTLYLPLYTMVCLKYLCMLEFHRNLYQNTFQQEMCASQNMPININYQTV